MKTTQKRMNANKNLQTQTLFAIKISKHWCRCALTDNAWIYKVSLEMQYLSFHKMCQWKCSLLTLIGLRNIKFVVKIQHYRHPLSKIEIRMVCTRKHALYFHHCRQWTLSNKANTKVTAKNAGYYICQNKHCDSTYTCLRWKYTPLCIKTR